MRIRDRINGSSNDAGAVGAVLVSVHRIAHVFVEIVAVAITSETIIVVVFGFIGSIALCRANVDMIFQCWMVVIDTRVENGNDHIAQYRASWVFHEKSLGTSEGWHNQERSERKNR